MSQLAVSLPSFPPLITVIDPRNGQTLYSVEEPSEADVHAMYARAQAAFERLRGMSVRQRLDEIDKLKQYILKNREHIARRIVEETGKCITDAMIMEIFPALDQIAYYQKNAAKILSDRRVKTPLLMFGKTSKIVYEPLGVVLVISPWNYPFNLSFLPFLGAFVAGNPVILKPSKFTPLKGVYEEMLEQSGFMPGAFQVAYASRRTAGLLIEKRPAKIHFTGSVEVGRSIMAQAAKHLIPVELELGGKDPMVVFDDVNLERTVNGALWGGFANCGQTCTSVERIFVQESIHDRFVEMLKDKVSKLVTLDSPEGRRDELALDVGCMTADFQIREIEGQIAEAKERGATFACGGPRVGASHVLPLTVVTDVTPDLKIQSNESFGPVVTVMRFKTEDEAVALANDSPFGLSASVWSADVARAERVARRLVTGNVSINNVLATQGNPALPFGGIKDSGFGRYRGAEGLHAFSNVKSILVDRQSSRLEAYWYPYSREKYGLFAQVIDAVFGGGALGLLKTLWLGMKLEIHTRKHRL
jgi:acyl-CoA reductase-like NAD-dependent aldehyde dehydrogenase